MNSFDPSLLLQTGSHYHLTDISVLKSIQPPMGIQYTKHYQKIFYSKLCLVTYSFNLIFTILCSTKYLNSSNYGTQRMKIKLHLCYLLTSLRLNCHVT